MRALRSTGGTGALVEVLGDRVALRRRGVMSEWKQDVHRKNGENQSNGDDNDGDHERPATAMACSSSWTKNGGDDGGSDE